MTIGGHEVTFIEQSVLIDGIHLRLFLFSRFCPICREDFKEGRNICNCEGYQQLSIEVENRREPTPDRPRKIINQMSLAV